MHKNTNTPRVKSSNKKSGFVPYEFQNCGVYCSTAYNDQYLHHLLGGERSAETGPRQGQRQLAQLVLHKRYQRGHHHGEPRQRQGGQHVAQGLAGPGGHHQEGVLTRQAAADRPPTQRAIITDRIISCYNITQTCAKTDFTKNECSLTFGLDGKQRIQNFSGVAAPGGLP